MFSLQKKRDRSKFTYLINNVKLVHIKILLLTNWLGLLERTDVRLGIQVVSQLSTFISCFKL